MKIMCCLVGFFLSGLFWLQAGENASDLDRMQGIWKVVSLTEKGKAAPANETELLEVMIVKDIFSVSEKGKMLVRYRLKLDPGQTPKAIDFLARISDAKEEKEKEQLKTELGIYAFEKEFLKLAIDEEGKLRPMSFEGKQADLYSVMVLKKKSSDKDAK